MRLPPSDMHEEFRFLGDEEIDVEPFEFMPRHVRLYIGAWMMVDEYHTSDEFRAALYAVWNLYENCGRPLIDQGPFPTTERIVSEMLWLTRESNT